jgi:hypothetical protein
MKALMLTLLLLYSCTKYSSLDRESIRLQLNEVEMDISHLNEITWDVGKRKDAKVSQSFTFIVDLPKIKSDDLDYLINEKNADSWILRLIVKRSNGIQDLGSLYALFRPQKTGRASVSSSSVSFKVYYAAAYASERFRAFKCPAFGHNKRINSMSVVGSNDKFTLSFDQVIPYQEKTQLVSLTPSAFNAGHSLVGEYFIEIAPYDSKRKMIHSSFKRLPLSVVIRGEDSVSVPGCEGIHEELN